jgi:hypothetical protein
MELRPFVTVKYPDGDVFGFYADWGEIDEQERRRLEKQN